MVSGFSSKVAAWPNGGALVLIHNKMGKPYSLLYMQMMHLNV